MLNFLDENLKEMPVKGTAFTPGQSYCPHCLLPPCLPGLYSVLGGQPGRKSGGSCCSEDSKRTGFPAFPPLGLPFKTQKTASPLLSCPCSPRNPSASTLKSSCCPKSPIRGLLGEVRASQRAMACKPFTFPTNALLLLQFVVTFPGWEVVEFPPNLF